MSVRICKKCGKEWPETTEFFRTCRGKKGQTYISWTCRECDRKAAKLWYADHDAKQVYQERKDYQKEYRERNKSAIKNGTLKRTFGIGLNDLFQMIQTQNGVCAICGSEIDLNDKHSYNVDHKHDTNEIRGILCAKCNRGIGHFNDNPTLLLSAAQYVST